MTEPFEIIINRGNKLIIGCDARSDVIVVPPESRNKFVRIVPELCRKIGYIACDSNGVLCLTIINVNIHVFIEDRRIVLLHTPILLKKGRIVSFGLYNQRVSFKFCMKHSPRMRQVKILMRGQGSYMPCLNEIHSFAEKLEGKDACTKYDHSKMQPLLLSITHLEEETSSVPSPALSLLSPLTVQSAPNAVMNSFFTDKVTVRQPGPASPPPPPYSCPLKMEDVFCALRKLPLAVPSENKGAYYLYDNPEITYWTRCRTLEEVPIYDVECHSGSIDDNYEQNTMGTKIRRKLDSSIQAKFPSEVKDFAFRMTDSEAESRMPSTVDELMDETFSFSERPVALRNYEFALVLVEMRDTLGSLRPLMKDIRTSLTGTPQFAFESPEKNKSQTFHLNWVCDAQSTSREMIGFETPNFFVKKAALDVLGSLDDAFISKEEEFCFFPQTVKHGLFDLFLDLASEVEDILHKGSLVLQLTSPILCCGDIHGSFADLRFILEKSVPFGSWTLLSTPLLFLGDYVDRGAHDVEVVLYLLAWFILCPNKIILLRGNHEDESVNGDLDQYGETSFLKKCCDFFGDNDGNTFWRRVNDIFSLLPLAAIVDGTLFLCHGGIPLLRHTANEDVDDLDDTSMDYDTPTDELFLSLIEGNSDYLQGFLFRTLFPSPDDDMSTAQKRRLVRELLWNDPVPEMLMDASGSLDNTQPESLEEFNTFGFRSNFGRGDGDHIVREFNEVAVDNFLRRWDFSHLIRAHQQKSMGAEIIMSGRVLTLFSCCNYAADTNKAGVCMLKDSIIQLISWGRSRRADSATKTNTCDTLPSFIRRPSWANGSDWSCKLSSRDLFPPDDSLRDIEPQYVLSSNVRTIKLG